MDSNCLEMIAIGQMEVGKWKAKGQWVFKNLKILVFKK